MGVASWSFVVRAVDGSGPAGGLALAEGLGGRLSCTGVRGGWLPGVFGVGNTPAVVGCWGCCGRGGLLVVGAPAWCGGGMLSGFWGSAPWLPGPCSAALFVGGGVWVWVGWL